MLKTKCNPRIDKFRRRLNDNPMPSGRVVLRASAKYWLTERIGPLLLLWSFAIVALALDGSRSLGLPVTEIGPERVSLTMPLWPTYAMSWAEVQRVALDHSDDQFVLYGPGKRLTLPGPRWWRRADREVGLGAIFGHLEQRGIPFERTARAGFALPRGTRVPRKAGK